MPELPEVETVRLGLLPIVEGARISQARAMRADLRFPLPEGFGQALTGKVVNQLRRRAKYLLWDIEGGLTLISHLGMSGRFRIYFDPMPPLEKHDHVIFRFENAEVRFNDPRRFGFMDFADSGDIASHPMIKSLGPEPLNENFSALSLKAALKGRTGPIKTALLDQTVVAGLGNIYVSEALFLAGIHPKTKAGRLSIKRLGLLVDCVKDVLENAIAAGGSSLRDHRQPDGELGYFQHAFRVYGRDGESCQNPNCSQKISRIQQSGRSTFFCKSCQR